MCACLVVIYVHFRSTWRIPPLYPPPAAGHRSSPCAAPIFIPSPLFFGMGIKAASFPPPPLPPPLSLSVRPDISNFLVEGGDAGNLIWTCLLLLRREESMPRWTAGRTDPLFSPPQAKVGREKKKEIPSRGGGGGETSRARKGATQITLSATKTREKMLFRERAHVLRTYVAPGKGRKTLLPTYLRPIDTASFGHVCVV